MPHTARDGLKSPCTTGTRLQSERDRLILGMLAPLGIEKGKPFAPDERQRELLTRAAKWGHVYSQAIAFEKRGGEYVEGSKWGFMITMNADQRAEHYDQIDERADYTYQGIWVGEGMIKKLIGKGSQYIGAYSDADDEWFDGSRNYRLHVPANVPADNFWSVTVYDSMTRSQIVNDELRPSVGSHVPMDINDDGSVDIYFGPKHRRGRRRTGSRRSPGNPGSSSSGSTGRRSPSLTVRGVCRMSRSSEVRMNRSMG